MKFNYPKCKKCKSELKIANFYGYCLNCTRNLETPKNFIEGEIIKPKPFKNWAKTHMLETVLLVPVLLFVLTAGVCKAYDMILLQMLENGLANNVSTLKTASQSCNSTYQALVELKNDNKITLQGTGNPCPLN